MNSTELLARVRTSAYIETANVDWTDPPVLIELFDQMTQLYERGVTKSNQGYWLKQITVPLTVGVDRYRIPSRACTGGLQRVEIAYDSTLDWQQLDLIDEKLAINYELPTGQRGTVARYCIRGDCINVLPDPDGSNFALRLNYYLRPSRIITAQTQGVVSAINTTTRTLTFTGGTPQSFDAANGTPTVLTSGAVIDVVSQSGWHEVQLVSEPTTLSGTVFTCTGTGDMGTIQVGDVIRAADQSEWPALPDDYHRSIADAAAASILRTRGMNDRADELMSKLGGDLNRFGDMLSPRVQSAAPAIVAPFSMYRGAIRGAYPVKFP